jgi:hypothetical protein
MKFRYKFLIFSIVVLCGLGVVLYVFTPEITEWLLRRNVDLVASDLKPLVIIPPREARETDALVDTLLDPNELDRVLIKYESDPLAGPNASALRLGMDEKIRFCKEQFKKAKGKRIDFIGQVHTADTVPEVSDQEQIEGVIISSQMLVTSLLQRWGNEIQLIGSEGEDGIDITFDVLVLRLANELETSDLNVARARLLSNRVRPLMWRIMYLSENPVAPVTGIEDRLIWDFPLSMSESHLSYVRQLKEKPQKKYLTQAESSQVIEGRGDQDLFITLSTAVGVARLLDQMEKRNYQRAALVYGLGHAKDFAVIAEGIGLSSAVYSTIY